MGCCSANKKSERVITRKKPLKSAQQIRERIEENVILEQNSQGFKNDDQEKNDPFVVDSFHKENDGLINSWAGTPKYFNRNENRISNSQIKLSIDDDGEEVKHSIANNSIILQKLENSESIKSMNERDLNILSKSCAGLNEENKSHNNSIIHNESYNLNHTRILSDRIGIQTSNLGNIGPIRNESINNTFERYISSLEAIIRDIISNGTDIPFVGFEKVIKNKKVQFEKRQFKGLSESELADLLSKEKFEIRKRTTDIKRIWIYAKIALLKKQLQDDFIQLVINRNFIYRDSFEQFKTVENMILQLPFKIFYIDEDAQDVGGVLRDWVTILVQEFLKKDYGFFIRADTPELSYIINRSSRKYNENHLEHFFFIGQVIGKALLERISISAFFNVTIFKYLLNENIDFDDFEFFDKNLYLSLKFIRDNTINKDELLTNFSVIEKDPFDGNSIEIELIENGKQVELNEDNKMLYISRLISYHTLERQKDQLEYLKNGFFSAIPPEIATVMDSDELAFFLCGETVINVEDWKNNTQYLGEYDENHYVISWFWTILTEMSQENLSRLLHFTTGSSRVPPEGFIGLQSSNGKSCKFCIESIGKNFSQFIIAHTCFNKLVLPLYDSQEEMKSLIVKVITTNDFFSFGIE